MKHTPSVMCKLLIRTSSLHIRYSNPQDVPSTVGILRDGIRLLLYFPGERIVKVSHFRESNFGRCENLYEKNEDSGVCMENLNQMRFVIQVMLCYVMTKNLRKSDGPKMIKLGEAFCSCCCESRRKKIYHSRDSICLLSVCLSVCPQPLDQTNKDRDLKGDTHWSRAYLKTIFFFEKKMTHHGGFPDISPRSPVSFFQFI